MIRSIICVLLFAGVSQAENISFKRTEDVIYGRKFGVALTLDVFEPEKKANGAGVIFCVSGGFFSAKEAINPAVVQPFINRGYVVFAVVHGSQPKFTIPEILEDMHRATRFIKANAKKYNIDPEKLGITGGSAGGHLSLMQGHAGRPGNAKAKDPVEQQSSTVAAVACFFPPTDFLNYGKPGEEALGTGTLKGFKAPFDFEQINETTRSFDRITDPEKRRVIGKMISPVYHVKEQSVPTLIAHGDKDFLVPIQQAELMIDKLKEKKIPCELIVKPGAGHGWKEMNQDLETFADWFDKHVVKKAK